MQNVRYEGSLLASLEELKRIEQQRVAEEQAAIAQAAAEREAAVLEAARSEREAVAAKLRAEHEAVVATERMRLEAEREARLRIEAEQAAERGRQMMALEEKRVAAELELRREEVAKTRPKWMLTVTAFAVVGAALLVFLALHWYQAAREADAARDEALQAVAAAQQHTRHAMEELTKAEADVKALAVKVDAAITALEEAQTIADRKVAEKRLRELQHQEQLKKEYAAQKAAELEHQKRQEIITIDQACLNNSLSGTSCKGHK
jgi:hypothetical protein